MPAHNCPRPPEKEPHKPRAREHFLALPRTTRMAAHSILFNCMVGEHPTGFSVEHPIARFQGKV